MSESVQEYRRIVSKIGGCTDGGCRIRKPNGMHTNGGCNCVKRGSQITPQHWGLIAYHAQGMADEIDRLTAKVMKLEVEEPPLPAFCLGEMSDCGPTDRVIEGALVLHPGDPSVGIQSSIELSGSSPLAAYIRELEAERERLREAVNRLRGQQRDPSRCVTYLGIRDNDYSREALRDLFSLSDTKQEG